MNIQPRVNLSIRLRAFEPLWITRTIEQLEMLTKTFTFLSTTSRVIIPRTTRRYTVIRSPHVNKHSREQYEKRTYNARIHWTPISLKHQQSIQVFLGALESLSYTGVELEIRLEYCTCVN